jgi:AbrB family looped-hinge helix DNA binding protein
MRTTIDSGGRVVIPKAVRDRLGLVPGAAVEVAEGDGVVEVRPASTTVELVEVEGVVVATGPDLPPLTDDVVRETIERTRR